MATAPGRGPPEQEIDMNVNQITPTTLTRAAGVAAAAAGALFVGINIGHPHLDVTSITTTEVVVRNSLKVLMAGLALAGITGMYLQQVRKTGVLGLVGYVLFSVGYLTILGTTFVAAFILPSIADTDPSYVRDLIEATTGGTAAGDIGAMSAVNAISGLTYLGGGLLFGIALYRARVLARWAAALLAVASVASVALVVMPDDFYRVLAYPNGVAMIGLGYSLWNLTRETADTTSPASTPSPAGAR
jgi:hypothetical protein